MTDDRTRTATAITLALLVGAVGLGVAGGAAVARHRRSPSREATQALRQLPLSFEANRGQFDPEAAFRVQGSGYTAFFTDDGPVWSLMPTKDGPGAALEMRLVGADRVEPDARDRLRGTTNYFLGDDPSAWHRGVPTFGRVLYRDVYPGVDLAFGSGPGNKLEYAFRLAPGADPDRIELSFTGADDLGLDEEGNLVVATPAGDVRHAAPTLFQPSPGGRRPVDGRFVLDGSDVRFSVVRYDRTLPLVIDPATDLVYSTFLGGGAVDAAYGMTLDANSDVYIAGRTDDATTDLPTTPGAFDRSINSPEDAFVAKLRPIGDGGMDLLYSTFLGGSAFDRAAAIAVDGSGNAYVTGITSDGTTDLPVTSGAYDTSYNGGTYDAFVAKINPAGGGATDLAYSTFLGGSGTDEGFGIAVEGGVAYVAGYTSTASGFPTTSMAYDETANGGYDAFLAKINPAGGGSTDLQYSTLLGGASFDGAYGVDVSSGIVFIAGETQDDATTDLPTTAGAYDTTHNGDYDGFLAKINLAGGGSTDLQYATYVGGNDYDGFYAMDVSGGVAYLVGESDGGTTPFPTTTMAYDTSFNGGSCDVVLAKVSPAGGGAADLQYGTFVGGLGCEYGLGVAVESGLAYVTGVTYSTDFPTTVGAFDTSDNGMGDAFLSEVDPAGGGSTDLQYGTFLGGSWFDRGGGIGVLNGAAYVAGTVDAPTDFPATPGAYDRSHNGGGTIPRDAFVAKLLGKYRPDAQIRKGSGAFAGDDTFNVNAKSQTRSARAKRGQTKTFTLEVVNDRSATDSYVLDGPGSTSKFSIKYFSGITNVTADVVAGTFTTSMLAGGASEDITIEIKPKSAANVGNKKSVLVNVASVANPNEQDSSKAKVTVRAG